MLDQKGEGAQGEATGVRKSRTGERVVILTHRRRGTEGISCSVSQVG